MTAESTGTWVARFWDDAHRKLLFTSFGPLDEYPDGKRFDKASELAREWFTHLGAGGSSKAYTVADACDAYVKHLRTEKGDDPAADAHGRFKRWVHEPALAQIDLSQHKRAHPRRSEEPRAGKDCVN